MYLLHLYPELTDKVSYIRDIDPVKLKMKPSEIFRLLKLIPEKVLPDDLFLLFPEKKHEKIKDLMQAHNRPAFFYLRNVLLYGIAECERSRLASRLLCEGRLEEFGRMMNISHNGDRVWDHSANAEYNNNLTDTTIDSLTNALQSEDPDKIIESQIFRQPGAYACSVKETDFLVDLVTPLPGVYGAQLSGAGLGGCIMILCRNDAVEKVKEILQKEYYNPGKLPSGITVCSPTNGGQVFSC